MTHETNVMTVRRLLRALLIGEDEYIEFRSGNNIDRYQYSYLKKLDHPAMDRGVVRYAHIGSEVFITLGNDILKRGGK